MYQLSNKNGFVKKKEYPRGMEVVAKGWARRYNAWLDRKVICQGNRRGWEISQMRDNPMNLIGLGSVREGPKR